MLLDIGAQVLHLLGHTDAHGVVERGKLRERVLVGDAPTRAELLPRGRVGAPDGARGQDVVRAVPALEAQRVLRGVHERGVTAKNDQLIGILLDIGIHGLYRCGRGLGIKGANLLVPKTAADTEGEHAGERRYRDACRPAQETRRTRRGVHAGMTAAGRALGRMGARDEREQGHDDQRKQHVGAHARADDEQGAARRKGHRDGCSQASRTRAAAFEICRHGPCSQCHHADDRKDRVSALCLERRDKVAQRIVVHAPPELLERLGVENVLIDKQPVVEHIDVVFGHIGVCRLQALSGAYGEVHHVAAGIEIGGIALPAGRGAVSEIRAHGGERDQREHHHAAHDRGDVAVLNEHPAGKGAKDHKRRQTGLGAQRIAKNHQQASEDVRGGKTRAALKGRMAQHQHKARAEHKKCHHGIGEIEGREDLEHEQQDAGDLDHRIAQARAQGLHRGDRIGDHDAARKHERVPGHARQHAIESRERSAHREQAVGHKPARARAQKATARIELLNMVIRVHSVLGCGEHKDRHHRHQGSQQADQGQSALRTQTGKHPCALTTLSILLVARNGLELSGHGGSP